ncbi:MAG TPA: phosphatase PAP2 family protein [Thermoplasmata archaeon]
MLPGYLAVQASGFDEVLFRALNLAGTNPLLDVVMALITSLALPYILPFLSLPLWWRGHRELAFDLLLLLVLVIVVTEILKYAIGRPRPCEILPDARVLGSGVCGGESDPAFPSGHASRVFAVAMLLAFRFKGAARPVGFAVAVLVGVSRVYLGVHWPTDVLGGAVVGIVLAVALELVARRSSSYRNIRGRFIGAVSRAFSRTSAT